MIVSYRGSYDSVYECIYFYIYVDEVQVASLCRSVYDPSYGWYILASGRLRKEDIQACLQALSDAESGKFDDNLKFALETMKK